MAYFKWGVGPIPLYDDKYGLTITSSECSQTTEESPLDLVEGHSYFITVLVSVFIIIEAVSSIRYKSACAYSEDTN